MLLLGIALGGCGHNPIGWTLDDRVGDTQTRVVEIRNTVDATIIVFERRGGVERVLGRVGSKEMSRFPFRGRNLRLVARTLEGEELHLHRTPGLQAGRTQYVAQRPRA